MSDKETEKKSKISDEIRRIAGVVEQEAKLEEVSGRKTFVSDTAFEKTLPEGHTIKQYEDCFDHVDNFVAGSNLAFGKLAGDAIARGEFNQDEDLKTLNMHIPIWNKNFIESCYTDVITRTNVNPQNKDEKITTTKHGEIRTAVKLNATQNRGQLKQVRSEISELAAEAAAKLNK